MQCFVALINLAIIILFNFPSDINTSKTMNILFKKKSQNINNDIVENLKHNDDNHPTEINKVITKNNKPKLL